MLLVIVLASIVLPCNTSSQLVVRGNVYEA